MRAITKKESGQMTLSHLPYSDGGVRASKILNVAVGTFELMASSLVTYLSWGHRDIVVCGFVAMTISITALLHATCSSPKIPLARPLSSFASERYDTDIPLTQDLPFEEYP